VITIREVVKDNFFGIKGKGDRYRRIFEFVKSGWIMFAALFFIHNLYKKSDFLQSSGFTSYFLFLPECNDLSCSSSISGKPTCLLQWYLHAHAAYTHTFRCSRGIQCYGHDYPGILLNSSCYSHDLQYYFASVSLRYTRTNCISICATYSY